MDFWGIVLELGASSALILLSGWLVCCAAFGLLVARWVGSPVWLGVLLGVALPILGPLICALIWHSRPSRPAAPTNAVTAGPATPTEHSGQPTAPTQLSSPAPPPRPRRTDLTPPGLRWTSIALLALVLAAGIIAMMSRWLVIDFGIPGARLPLPPHPLAAVSLGVTAALIIGCLALAIFRRSIHLGAILVLPAGVAWLTFGAVAMLAVDRARSTIREAASEFGTLGELLAFLGIDPGSISDLEVAGVRVDPTTIALDAPPNIGIGSAWLLMMGAGALLILWTVCVAFWPRLHPRPETTRSTL